MRQKGRSSRPFTNIVERAIAEPTQYESGSKFLASLLPAETAADAKFSLNSCLFLGFKASKDAKGHAVAIHRRNVGGRFHLFDPNAGVFEMDLAKLKEAIDWLIQEEHKIKTPPFISHSVFRRR